jgi:hypothetical protein
MSWPNVGLPNNWHLNPKGTGVGCTNHRGHALRGGDPLLRALLLPKMYANPTYIEKSPDLER